MAAIVALTSDWHCGSTVGLQPPKFRVNDGQVIRHSKEQAWLWECWESYWEQVFALAKGRPVIAITNGDLIEGLHHQTTQVVSARLDEHEALALKCARTFIDKTDSLYVVRGTPSHVTEGAQSEERIAKALDAIPEAENRYTHHTLWLEVEGVRMHVAHHRGGTHRPWTKGNSMRTVVLKMISNCFEAKVDAPHLVFRSHRHKFEDTRHEHSRWCRGLATGAWQLKTDYVTKIDPEEILSEVGGYAIKCFDGKYRVNKIEFAPTEATKVGYQKWTAKHL